MNFLLYYAVNVMKMFGFIDNRLIKIELSSQKYQIATYLQFFLTMITLRKILEN